MLKAYCGQPIGKLQPHAYAIAENAYRSMLSVQQRKTNISEYPNQLRKTRSRTWAEREKSSRRERRQKGRGNRKRATIRREKKEARRNSRAGKHT